MPNSSRPAHSAHALAPPATGAPDLTDCWRSHLHGGPALRAPQACPGRIRSQASPIGRARSQLLPGCPCAAVDVRARASRAARRWASDQRAGYLPHRQRGARLSRLSLRALWTTGVAREPAKALGAQGNQGAAFAGSAGWHLASPGRAPPTPVHPVCGSVRACADCWHERSGRPTRAAAPFGARPRTGNGAAGSRP